MLQHPKKKTTLFNRYKKWLTGISAVLLVLFYFSLPKKIFETPTSYTIEDREGNLLNASIASDGQWRFPLQDEVPQKFIDCITTFEDKRFFIHPGVDVKAMGRAFISNLNGNATQGGSTISMQVIRLSQQNKRTLFSKIKESVLALRLEFSYSKKEVLSMYASNAPFGGNVVGLEAAAWRYYGRDARHLSWGEMATLAVLPNAPSLVHPGRNREVLLSKRNRLLQRLRENGRISEADAYLAMQEPLPNQPLALPQLAPHLLQLFKKENKVLQLPTGMKTSIDGNLQKNVNQIITQHHGVLKGNNINNICALVLDVTTGEALAYVGNIYQPQNKELESDVDVIQAPRSPGSALKPILYAAMLSDGILLPNMLVADIPTQISGYAPQNFDRKFDGAVPAKQALARSLNVPAVRLLQQYKYPRFYEILQQYGIRTLNNPADFYGLSLILGGCEVSMWDMAGMYASLARILNHQQKDNGNVNGSDIHAPVYQINKKTTDKKQQANFPLDATSIYHTFEAMQEVMRPGEEGLWQQFNSSKRIAWKTGTSFGFRDAWSIGVTPQYIVAVWVGNADGEGRAGLTGIETAAPVMFDIFRSLPNTGKQWFTKPTHNYSYIPVCKQTGFRANIDCIEIDTLQMPPLAARAALCPYHTIVQLDASGTYRVNESCVTPSAMQQKSWFVLPPTMEFYYRQRHHDYKILPSLQPGCSDASMSNMIEIVYPQPNISIYVPLEIDGQRGKTVFTAAHKNSDATIFWSVDEEFIGSTQRYHQLAMSPAAGKHLLTLTDEKGNSISRAFEVIEKK